MTLEEMVRRVLRPDPARAPGYLLQRTKHPERETFFMDWRGGTIAVTSDHHSAALVERGELKDDQGGVRPGYLYRGYYIFGREVVAVSWSFLLATVKVRLKRQARDLFGLRASAPAGVIADRYEDEGMGGEATVLRMTKAGLLAHV